MIIHISLVWIVYQAPLDYHFIFLVTILFYFSSNRGFLDNGKHSLQTRGLIVLLIAKSAGAAAGSNDQHEMVSGIYPK